VAVEIVGRLAGSAAEQRRRADDSLSDAVAEFRGRVARERGDEDLADRQRIVRRQRERDVRRDGIGLARAGAGIDDRADGQGILRVVERARARACLLCGVLLVHDNVYPASIVNSCSNAA
jgi:hypothetical protein